MLKVGITGGIGSGKSTVSKVFEVLGVPVYYADDAAKRLMIENDSIREQLILHFGEVTYKNNLLNRSHLSAQVFNNREKLDLLNSIVHPATLKDSADWMKNQSAPYSIKEAALLFESGASKYLDFIIGVSAPVELRIERVMERDGITREAIEQRINKQMDEAGKMDNCNEIILNDNMNPVIPQVLKLHERLLLLAKAAV